MDDEPNEKCPIHSGFSEYPKRCGICGQFIKIKGVKCV